MVKKIFLWMAICISSLMVSGYASQPFDDPWILHQGNSFLQLTGFLV